MLHRSSACRRCARLPGIRKNVPNIKWLQMIDSFEWAWHDHCVGYLETHGQWRPGKGPISLMGSVDNGVHLCCRDLVA